MRAPHTYTCEDVCELQCHGGMVVLSASLVIALVVFAMDSVFKAFMGGNVTLVYRRSEAEMPARLEEVKHAKEEGINFLTLHNPCKSVGTPDVG